MSSAKTTKITPNAAATVASPSLLSAEAIAQNEDILHEILLRLPIKSLMRFKSVSKPWLSHITSTNFVRNRTAYCNQSISGLILRRRSRPYLHGIPEFDYFNLSGGESSAISSGVPFTNGRLTFTDGGKSAIGILQSSNGLLLCTKVLKRSYFQTPASPRECYIYNPATRRYSVLPRNISSSAKVLGFSLAFDPSKSPYYEVICVCGDSNSRDNNDQHWIEIYSSETRRWRLSTCGSFHTEQSSVRFDGGVYWNGTIHWISLQGIFYYFKLDEEQIREIRMSPVNRPCFFKRYRYFGESNGHLHLIDHVEDLESPSPSPPCFDVYEMAEDYSGWFVKFLVDLSGFPQTTRRNVSGLDGLQDFLLYVLCVVRCEPEEESYMVVQTPGELLRYKFKTKVFEKIYDVGPEGSDVNWHSLLMLFPVIGMWPDDAYQYVETLTPV
ncbi:F-box protein [Morus notabilis]|uniref:F-box protein n=1 Tax=Morus notabilis TaxID=981085 RepID=W9S9I4_9ROSA|nr:F-box protein At5g07610 [Morus notabilis]EXC20947.1 F-box protein [Morus notabilis]